MDSNHYSHPSTNDANAWGHAQSNNGTGHQQPPQYSTQEPQYQQPRQQQVARGQQTPPQPWQASYCGCCSPFDLCMKAFCCPCFVYGKTHHRIRENGNMEGYDSVNSSCMIFTASLCLGLNWMPVWLQRADMRKKYNLQGNGCTDCLSACCCPLCDMVQQEKEAQARELGGHGKPVVQGYQAQGGMAYPGQSGPAYPQPAREK
ncbi:unnamed protein product [Discula destructiva]